jgi:peptidoglycan/xylan/chitin deacetylase (PgdA/CDA1 family)
VRLSAVSLAVVLLLGCSGPAVAPDAGAGDGRASDAAVTSLSVVAVAPSLGTIEGGTLITIEGSGFVAGAAVAVGGVPCSAVDVASMSLLTCTTGGSDFVEGAKDVVVTTPDGNTALLASAFTYECPWTTSSGRRSCGAVPPKPPFAAQPIAAWVTQFESGHGFVANLPASLGDNLNDTTQRMLGTQSAVLETDGAGTVRTLTRTGLPPIDFTNQTPKLWVKLDNAIHESTLQVVLGTGDLANQFRFSFHSTQGQRWTTEGDWVAFSMSWSPENVTTIGTPDRAAITDVQIRLADDATGNPVRLHVNGIALVPEPIASYPEGVVSFTFDDNFASMVSEGLPILAQHNFPATAYVIVDLVGDAGRASIADLTTLQNTHGWQIAAHSYVDQHHAARFPNLTADVIEDDMVDSRAWLIANRFRGYDHCAYPGGEFTGGLGANVLALARTYFSTCRTIYQGERETYLPADSAKLRVLYVTNGVTLARALAAVDTARANREWIILVFHSLVAAPAVTTQWSTADFASLVDHIASTGMPVKTVGELLGP